jgi:hypothetical protein
MSLKSTLLAVALAAPLAWGAAGCDDKKPSSDTARTDAGATDKYATADPKLAKALQAAASATAASDTGPPPDGIFAPGAADHRHAKGVPTKVDFLSDGADPKISLDLAADASVDAARATSYGPALLELVQQQQRGAGLALAFQLLLAPGKPDDGGPDTLVATVKAAGLAKDQGGQVPPDLDKAVASLQGSALRVKVSADGKQSDVSMVMSKTAKPELDRFAQSAAEALSMNTIPLPGRPVGVGAQWIAETRMPLSGLDVITYRAFKVKSIDGDRVHLTLDVKVYAASKEVQLAGLPQGAELQQFDAIAQGELELVRGESLARTSDVQQRVVLAFSPPGGMEKPDPQNPQQPQMMTAQILQQATFVRGDDLRKALKHP